MEWIFGETMGFNVSLRKEDSLEEGKPFLVVGQKVLDCATPDTFDVQLCNRAIVQLSLIHI